MARLPYSRVINVNLTRNDRFASRRGFGVALFLHSKTIVGIQDATNITKAYASIDEVAADFAPADEFYKAAVQAFAQNPRPIQIKAGWYDSAAVTEPVVDPATGTPVIDPATGTPVVAVSAANLQTALDAIYDRDQSWYWLSVETALRDTAALDGLVNWVEAKRRQALITSNDVLMEDPADTTSFAARHKNTVERTSVFYHTDADEFVAFALAASLGTRNFDQADSAYTGKFKKLATVSPVDIGVAAVQAVTAFAEQLGQAVATGHNANTYVDIGGLNMVVEGSTLTPNVFIDEVHSSDWIVSRTEEETLAILTNNDRVPFTDQGIEQLAGGVRTVMRQARRAGIVASDLDPLTGEYSPSVIVTVPSVFDVPESQRKQRIAPVIRCDFRYAGAVHYTTINYQVSF